MGRNFRVFGKLDKLEKRVEVNDVRDRMSSGCRKIFEGAKEFLVDQEMKPSIYLQEMYTRLLKNYKEMECSLEEVKEFCKFYPELEGYENFRSLGMYMTYMFNKTLGPQDEIVLIQDPELEPLNYIGTYQHKGAIRIVGDVGKYTGAYQHGGVLHVMGNTTFGSAYEMQDGELIIDGDINEQYFCQHMMGGLVRVNGPKGFDAPFVYGGKVKKRESYWVNYYDDN